MSVVRRSALATGLAIATIVTLTGAANRPSQPTMMRPAQSRAGSASLADIIGVQNRPAVENVPAAPIAAPAHLSEPKEAQMTAREDMMDFHWYSDDQFRCLRQLWNRESRWHVHSGNPGRAYGIPQALPGSKMRSAGPDWRSNPDTQIRWGLGYIKGRYGSPCGAWRHSEGTGWY